MPKQAGTLPNPYGCKTGYTMGNTQGNLGERYVVLAEA
jgi:hypothetical protein